MASSSLFLILFLLHCHILTLHSADQKHTSCPLFTCGIHGEIGFPFTSTSSSSHPDCGSFNLNCTDPVPMIQFSKQDRWFRVLNMSYSDRTIFISDPELQSQLDTNRCDSLTNFTPLVFPS